MSLNKPTKLVLNKNKNKQNVEKEKMQKSSQQKRRERRRARLKRRIRTNSGAISMFEVEASSMVEPVSTKKNSESTETARTATTVCSFQTCEVESRFARFTEFFIYASF